MTTSRRTVDLPSLKRGEIRDPALTAALRKLELTVRRKLDGVLHGDHLGLLPGPGSEPGESRIYQPGDDVRRMDWAVTARTNHPHVRQMIADRELETWLVIDMSASLDFGTVSCEKRDLAAIEASKAKTTAAIGILDAQLAKTAYVAGDAFSMGDIPVGVFSYRFHALVPDRPPLPHFERWYQALAARPAFRDHILSMPLD